jgi:DNA-binding transcriptional MerR regulator
VLHVLAFVAQSRRLGLTLGEVRRIVALRCAGPGPCPDVRRLLEQKVSAAEKMLRELRRRLASWSVASRHRGAVCAHIEGKGGEPRLDSWERWEYKFCQKLVHEDRGAQTNNPQQSPESQQPDTVDPRGPNGK